MKKTSKNAIATTLTMLALPAFIQAAHAAATGPMEEIVVTAQKRVQAVSDVGMSINAVTGDTLKELNVTSAAELNKITPGLSVIPGNTGIAGAPVFTLRGVGFNENSLSALSAVSFYVDEVALPYVYMAGGPTLDIERVEVLKGPQGTLFGQNATGGAINYIARHPTEKFEAGIEGSYGTYNRMDVDGYVSGPLSDTVKARLAARSIVAKGWQKSTSRSDTLGDVDQQSGRFLLDWNPNDKLLVELNLNGWLDRSESQAAQLTGFNPSVAPLFNPGVVLPIPGTVSPYDQVTTGKLSPNKNTAADWTPGHNYSNHTYFTQESLRLEWDMSRDVTLTSLTANSLFRKKDFHDTDANAENFGSYSPSGDIKAFSQELRLNGEAWDRLNWITGVSYADDHIKSDNPSDAGSTTLGLALAVSNPSGGVVVSDTERKTQAIFASGDYDLTDTVSLTAGIRYTDVKLDYTGCTEGLGGDLFELLLGAGAGECYTQVGATPADTGLVSRNMDETNTSWRGGVNWKATPDTLVYGFISRGFKSGDFPSLTALNADQLKPVKQEQLTAYEIGVKSHLFDNTVAVNAAAFYYDYKDKQLYSLVPVQFLSGPAIAESTINVPKSHVEGGELDLTWFPLEGLTLHTGVGYTHSEVDGNETIFTGFSSPTWPPAAGFVTMGQTDITGSSFNLAPEWQVNFDGQYQWRINDMMNAFVGASAVYASKTTAFLGVEDKPSGIPEYGTLDLRAGLESPDGRWRASVWGRNVTDELYVVSATRGYDVTSRFVGQPATYGVTVGYKFD